MSEVAVDGGAGCPIAGVARLVNSKAGTLSSVPPTFTRIRIHLLSDLRGTFRPQMKFIYFQTSDSRIKRAWQKQFKAKCPIHDIEVWFREF